MAYTFTRTGAQIEEIHNTVEDPKSNTQFSDDIRTIAGEYRGLWPDTGGSANKGDTYQTQVGGSPTGQYFTALQNTTVDPAGDDVNWRSVVSATSLQTYEATSVADMVAGVSQFGVIGLSSGQRWCSGGTSWEHNGGDSGTIADFYPLGSICVNDFGSVFSLSLQSAVTYVQENLESATLTAHGDNECDDTIYFNESVSSGVIKLVFDFGDAVIRKSTPGFLFDVYDYNTDRAVNYVTFKSGSFKGTLQNPNNPQGDLTDCQFINGARFYRIELGEAAIFSRFDTVVGVPDYNGVDPRTGSDWYLQSVVLNSWFKICGGTVLAKRAFHISGYPRMESGYNGIVINGDGQPSVSSLGFSNILAQGQTGPHPGLTCGGVFQLSISSGYLEANPNGTDGDIVIGSNTFVSQGISICASFQPSPGQIADPNYVSIRVTNTDRRYPPVFDGSTTTGPRLFKSTYHLSIGSRDTDNNNKGLDARCSVSLTSQENDIVASYMYFDQSLSGRDEDFDTTFDSVDGRKTRIVLSEAGVRKGYLEHQSKSIDGFIGLYNATAGSYAFISDDSGNLRAGVDGGTSCGTVTSRFSEIFAVNDTINTSDEREKEFIEITEAERKCAVEVKASMRKYKWNSAIEEKGNDARLHFGVGAQTVKEIFESNGLDAHSYGLFCYDEWDDTLDVHGNVAIPSGNRYGVRYTELLCFLMSSL